MAYPFLKLPYFKDIIQKLDGLDIKLETLQKKELNNGHSKVDVQFFRKSNGNDVPDTLVPAPPLDPDDYVTHDVLHSLCRRLGLHAKQFGFPLGFVEYDVEDEED